MLHGKWSQEGVPHKGWTLIGEEDLGEPTRGFVDKVLDTIPGLGTTLPARYDAFGDPIVSRNGLWSGDKAGAVDREMQRLALQNDKAPTRVPPCTRDQNTIKNQLAWNSL